MVLSTIRATESRYEFMEKYPDEQAATNFFEQRRWGDYPQCPHCLSHNTARVKNAKPMPHRCRDCRKHFSVRTGTVMERSKIPLHKWLMAIWMLHTARKSVSSIQMAKELGISQQAAWFLQHRIRESMIRQGHPVSGTFEIDETYIGGRESNRHSKKKKRIGRGTAGKQPVLGFRDRHTSTVRAYPIPNVRKHTLHTEIAKNVQDGSTIYTDELASYNSVKGVNRVSVQHNAGEYVRDDAHTNGIESFWALLKRGYHGTNHWWSVKHIHRYVAEYTHRPNAGPGNTPDVLGSTFDRMIGIRLTYRDLTSPI